MSDITKKPERLSSAVYLLTSFFDEKEPMKWDLRSLASELLTSTAGLRGMDPSSYEYFGIHVIVRKIISLLMVARNAGLISSANFDVIVGEFNNYLDLMPKSKIAEDEDGRVAIGHEYFLTPDRNEDNRKIKDNYSSTHLQVVKHEPQHSLVRSSDNAEKIRKLSAVSVKKNNRQSIIVSILKRKKDVTIKDITPLVNGCSEKTVQRELLEMVEAGVLKKTGEKRWSRYSLA